MVHEADEVSARESERGGIDAGMEAEAGDVAEVLVEKEADVVLGVMDEAEGSDGTGHDTEIALHASLGSEGELAFAEAMLDGVDVHRAVAGEDDEVVAVAFVVAEEEVLAEIDVAAAEVLLSYVEGGEGRMFDVIERDAELAKEGVELGWADHGKDAIRCVR